MTRKKQFFLMLLVFVSTQQCFAMKEEIVSLDPTQISYNINEHSKVVDLKELNAKLAKAIIKNNLKLVTELLNQGIDANTEYHSGERPLHNAVPAR